MRIAMTAAAMLTLSITLPAAAQIRDSGMGRGWPVAKPALPGVTRDLHQADQSIRDARDTGQLSRKDARALKREARMIAALEERQSRDGLTGSEQAALQQRVEALRSVASARRKP